VRDELILEMAHPVDDDRSPTSSRGDPTAET
jgi:hypothetical protein